MQTIIGWLFGLESKSGAQLSGPNVTLREMTSAERARILRASQDFFAKDIQIWTNCLARFPLVFEKKASDKSSLASLDTVAVILSLLARGEIRTPLIWAVDETGNGPGSSSSEVIDCFYRLINGRFHTIEFEAISESATVALEKLKFALEFSPNQYISSVILDRIFESKRHLLTVDAHDSEIIARAADLCICLESLYGEGQGETQFKLGMAVAWLLESNPLKREAVMKAITDTYSLRSKILHGATLGKPITKEIKENVISADRLLRRSILTQALNRLNKTTWIETFRNARLGVPFQLDTALWVEN